MRLILQGEPDMPIAQVAASMLYHHLLHAGVRIYEYCERPLHGKVALTDDLWSTVGSSNLDPLTLSLNLEANVMIRDRAFNQRARRTARRADAAQLPAHRERATSTEWSAWRLVRSFFVFHFLRWYPTVGRLAAAPCAARCRRCGPTTRPTARGGGGVTA